LGLLLHKVTGLPWVADFRDPMLYHNTNVTGVRECFYQWIEKQTIRHCRYAIFTTPSAITQYAHIKFPEYPESKWVLIENGFDEADFLSAEKLNPAMGIPHKKKVLLHSGGLFPEERDPSCFFKAVALLLSEGMISDGMVNIILRASGDEVRYQAMIDALGLQNIIFLAPKLDYQEALAEMLSVDGLLVFQGSLCNFQVPAKLYEYLRARKPILALTDPSGDTAFLLRRAELEYMADLDNVQDIALKLCTLIQKLIAGDATVINNEFIARQSREQRTLLLRDVFERCLSE